jgi:hypothetical protein
VTVWSAAGWSRPCRRVEPTVPPRVHYRLTPLGLSLEGALVAVRAWAEEHMAEIDRANRPGHRLDEGSFRRGPTEGGVVKGAS